MILNLQEATQRCSFYNPLIGEKSLLDSKAFDSISNLANKVLSKLGLNQEQSLKPTSDDQVKFAAQAIDSKVALEQKPLDKIESNKWSSFSRIASLITIDTIAQVSLAGVIGFGLSLASDSNIDQVVEGVALSALGSAAVCTVWGSLLRMKKQYTKGSNCLAVAACLTLAGFYLTTALSEFKDVKSRLSKFSKFYDDLKSDLVKLNLKGKVKTLEIVCKPRIGF